MIASTQITNTEIPTFIAVYNFVYKKNRKLNEKITAKLYAVEMRNDLNGFEIRKQSFVSAFLICMNVPLIILV